MPEDGPLIFERSSGRYATALASKGYPAEEACARDCAMLNGLAPDEQTYCVDGVQADAVFSVTKAPTLAGVAGTGGACAHDSAGRPTWLVFTWIQDATGMAGSTEQLVAEYRALVIHELLHALGFSNLMFRAARDAAGERKELIGPPPRPHPPITHSCRSAPGLPVTLSSAVARAQEGDRPGRRGGRGVVLHQGARVRARAGVL